MKRLWLVGIKRGQAGVCQPCRDSDHESCEPVPVAVDQMGIGIESTGYIECKCLCLPSWMRQALENGHIPPLGPPERVTVFELAQERDH